MKKIFLILVSVFATTSAFANFYVDAFGGCNVIESVRVDDGRIHLDIGYVAGGALGCRFSRYFRVEAEGAYRENSLDYVTTAGIQVPVSGKLTHATALGNAIIEVPIFMNVITPYFGGGFGRCWEQGSVSLPGTTHHIFEGANQSYAYQGIAGVTFCNACLFKAGLEYRYLDGQKIRPNHAGTLNLRVGF